MRQSVYGMASAAGLVALWMMLTPGAHAAGGVACVKAQCEGTSRACVEALYVAHEACMRAGNAKCASVPAAEKFKCLTTELTPCARKRNKEQDACLASFRTCYQTCAPYDGKRADYWCVATAGKTGTAAFCAADPAAAKHIDQCAKAFSSSQPHQGLTCESL